LVLEWHGMPWARAFHWVHLCSLFVLLSVVGAASMVVIDGLAFGASLSRLPNLLYWWVPSALGIVAAVMPVRQHTLSRALLLLVVGVGLLLALDLLGGALHGQLSEEWALIAGESKSEIIRRNVAPESWVMTLWSWSSGRLDGVSAISSTYDVGHPRPIAVLALAEAGAVFLALGTLGTVLALRKWIDRNVTFRTPSSDLMSGAVLGWIISPGLAVIAGDLTSGRMTGVLFEGEPLLNVLIPSAALAVLGLLGLRYALRRGR
jgi:hypothetical protein